MQKGSIQNVWEAMDQFEREVGIENFALDLDTDDLMHADRVFERAIDTISYSKQILRAGYIYRQKRLLSKFATFALSLAAVFGAGCSIFAGLSYTTDQSRGSMIATSKSGKTAVVQKVSPTVVTNPFGQIDSAQWASIKTRDFDKELLSLGGEAPVFHNYAGEDAFPNMTMMNANKDRGGTLSACNHGKSLMYRGGCGSAAFKDFRAISPKNSARND